MDIKFSTVLITFNEERNIKAFIEMFSFSDEIVLVDSFSSDNTIKIAQEYKNVKIYQRKFDDFTTQKNYAMSLAKNDWILFFDADERINEEFKKEINQLVSFNSEFKAFLVKRNFYFKNKLIKYSGFQNDYAVRVLNKKYCKYKLDKYVHEQIECDGKIGKINSSIDHFSVNSIENFQNKLDLYSQLKAKELFDKKIKPNLFLLNVKPLFRFLHHYVFRFGFLDGKEGLLMAKLFKNHVKLRYFYLKNLYNSEGKL